MLPILLLCLIPFTPVNAKVSFAQAQQIYKQIVNANGMWFYPPLELDRSLKINAESKFLQIEINQGALNKLTLEEVAFVLGHELGHWRSWHVESTWENEYVADRKGFYYVKRAGFNACLGASKFFHRIGKGASLTHPPSLTRLQKLPC